MEEKKKHIIKNVGKLYLKFGVRSVTMDDVAQEFGISKKTLYQYFADKADLVSQVINYYIKNPVYNLNNVGRGNAIDHYFLLRSHIINILRYFNNTIEFDLKKLYPQLYKKLHQVKRERIFGSTVANINEGISTGFYRTDLDVELIAKLQVGRTLYTLNPDNEVFTESEVLSIDVFDKVMEYHMYAICTEKGIKYFKQQLNNIKNEDKN